MPVLYVAGVSLSENPKDVSPVTLEAVRKAHLIIGEERRFALRLISASGAGEKELYLINEHSSDSDREQALKAVMSADTSVFFSDAGTPCISDPDFKFVAMCRNAGIEIRALPGPSSVTAAVSVSGIDAKRFFFAGFPPRSGPERERFFRDISLSGVTSVFMERPYALEATLRDMASFVSRAFSLSVDLGGRGERTLYGRAEELLEKLSGVKAPFVAVVPPAGKKGARAAKGGRR